MSEPTLVKKKLTEIKPYWNNPRDNESAIDAVVASIQEFGYLNPIVVDHENVIIAGHTRYKALLKLGWQECNVMVAYMPAETARGYRIIDNKTSEKAKWKQDELTAELRRFTGLKAFQTYFPELNIHIAPVETNIRPITQDQIEQTAKKQEATFENAHKDRVMRIQRFTCPHCGQDFETV